MVLLLCLLRLRSPFSLLSVLAFLFVFMLFRLLPGLVAGGRGAAVPRPWQGRVSGRRRAGAACRERR